MASDKVNKYEYKVTGNNIPIRESNSATSANLGFVNKNTTIWIQSVGSVWAKIASDHPAINLEQPGTGKTKSVKIANKYIHSDYIQPVSAGGNSGSTAKNPTVTDLKAKDYIYGYVAIAKANLYKEAGSTAAVSTIAKSTHVCITKTSTNGRYYILSEGLWIQKDAIECEDKDVSKEEAENHSQSIKDIQESIDQLGDSIALSKDKTDSAINGLLINSLTGIHGVPYQFMPTADSPFSDTTSIGRVYAERIVSKMPLLLLTPGEADFLPSFTSTERKNIIKSLLQKTGGDHLVDDNLNTLIESSGRYYTFKFAYADYYKYVNKLCRYGAICLGIGDIEHANYAKLPNNKVAGKGKSTQKYTKLSEYKWQNAVNKKLKGFINAQEFVAFYVDSNTSISEDFSTSSSPSQLASAFTSTGSEYAKELQFLTGNIFGKKLKVMDPDGYDSAKQEIDEIISKHVGASKLFSKTTDIINVIGRGGRIRFPEIWDDTEFSKSYNIDIKLRTPDADKISWYLNIYVPLMHLIALAAPRELGPNGYKSPFLVRGYYKGIFNLDMGIISSMSISKGREGAWSIDGLPTEVDVSISFKDLYGQFTISKKSGYKFFTNTCLIDYLSNTCGININKPEVSRLLESYVLFEQNRISDIYSDAWLGLQNKASNIALKAYDKLMFRN